MAVAQCRPARQAGSVVGLKAWTTLDSLELLDQDGVLMALEAPSGAGSTTRGGYAADSSAEASLSASADPGMSVLPTPPPPAARQPKGNELREQLEGAVHQRVCLSWLGRLYRCRRVLLQGIGASGCEYWPGQAVVSQNMERGTGCQCSPHRAQKPCRTGPPTKHLSSGSVSDQVCLTFSEHH